MSRTRWLLATVSVVVALTAAGLVGATWQERADEICAKEAPSTAGEYSVAWHWDQFAYVCDYRAPAEPPRSVGILDAFHSGGRRHGG